MDKKFLKQMEEKLLKEKDRLEKKLKTFATPNPRAKDDYDTNFPNIGESEEDNATEVAIYNDNLTLERTLEKELQDVKSALARIKRGTYGKCKYCKKEIDPKRLLARPSSSACVACKKRLSLEV
jgi:RNA polymerase-binding transcription factor DksA